MKEYYLNDFTMKQLFLEMMAAAVEGYLLLNDLLWTQTEKRDFVDR
jgi:hypothetical protein